MNSQHNLEQTYEKIVPLSTFQPLSYNHCDSLFDLYYVDKWQKRDFY